MITISIAAETSELLAAHVGWLAQKLGAADVIGQVVEHKKAKLAAVKAIEKAAQPEVANTGSNGSGQDAAYLPEPVAEEPPHLPVEVAALTAPASEAVAPISKKALQTIAGAKSKKVGVETVRDVIATFGGKTINDTDEAQLSALQTALEAL